VVWGQTLQGFIYRQGANVNEKERRGPGKQFFFGCQGKHFRSCDSTRRWKPPLAPGPQGTSPVGSPPSEKPTGPPSATGASGWPPVPSEDHIFGNASGVRSISVGVLSRLFPGRARGQAAARGRGAPSPRHPCSTLRRPGKRIAKQGRRDVANSPAFVIR